MNINGSILLREEFKHCSAFKSLGTKINSINILDTKMYKEIRAIVYPGGGVLKITFWFI